MRRRSVAVNGGSGSDCESLGFLRWAQLVCTVRTWYLQAGVVLVARPAFFISEGPGAGSLVGVMRPSVPRLPPD